MKKNDFTSKMQKSNPQNMLKQDKSLLGHGHLNLNLRKNEKK